MLPWNGLADECQRLFVGEVSELVGIDAVALQALGTAEPAPFGDQLRVALQDAKQHLLVIAEQEDGPDSFAAIGPQPLDHLGRARAAVDEVADEDEQGVARRAMLQLGMNFREQLLQQVEAAVDVADGIGPVAGSAGRPAIARRRDVQHQAADWLRSSPASTSR